MNNSTTILSNRRSKRRGTSLLAIGYVVSILCICVGRYPAAANASATIERISLSSSGQQLAEESTQPSISRDGRFVIYDTSAPGLVTQDLNGTTQIVLHDRQANTNTLVSINPAGQLAANASGGIISGNGRYVAFEGTFPGDRSVNIYEKDLQTGAVTNASPRYTDTAPPFDGLTFPPGSISDDGRYVVFTSIADNIMPGAGVGYHVFARDTVNGTYINVNSDSDGNAGDGSGYDPTITADGRYVLFGSAATNLDPNRPIYPWYGIKDLYIKDLVTGVTRLVSTGTNGQYSDQGSGAGVISANGQYMAFLSSSTNLGVPAGTYGPGLYLKNLSSGEVTLINNTKYIWNTSLSGGRISISSDGQKVAFVDAGDDSPRAIQNVLLWNKADNSTTTVTNASIAGQYPVYTHLLTNSALTDNGSVVFSSRESDLVPDDTNGLSDVFLYGKPFDSTPPTVVGTSIPAPNANGWNNTDVTVNWATTDPDSAATIPAPTPVTAEGTNQIITSDLSCDPTNNCAAGSVTLNIDKQAPTLAIPVWANNPKPLSGTNSTATMTITATDNLSGIQKAEYFIGSTDPGQGNGAVMNVSNLRTNSDDSLSADLSTTFGTNFTTPGRYAINVRSQDPAGNWSDIETDYLIVYDQSGPTDVAASKQVVPSAANGDNLPGIADSGKNDKANLGFDVSYTTSGAVAASSYVNLDYAIGNACESHPQNCLSTNFAATTIAPNSIDWLTITNSGTVGAFQGTGTLTINDHGAVTTTNNPFKVVATASGTRSAAIYLYAPGANPSTASPLYQLTISASGNWVKIQ